MGKGANRVHGMGYQYRTWELFWSDDDPDDSDRSSCRTLVSKYLTRRIYLSAEIPGLLGLY